MKRIEFVQDSLPEDVALKIVSCLEVSDVCSLGSCSKYWREICESDYLWKSFCEERWPGLNLDEEAETCDDNDQQKESNLKGWRGLYIKKRNEMVGHAADIKKSLSCQPINVIDYLKAIEDMKSVQFGFTDVQIFFLKSKTSVLLNLVGLHYCIKMLSVQVGSVTEALTNCKVQDRQVHIQWWKNGGWIHRFRLPDELHSRCISLGDLTTPEGKEVLWLLEQGVTREFVRVQISSAKCK